jgi:hypothetical protein
MRGDGISMKVLFQWLFAILAGISAIWVTLFGWLALSLGGPVRGVVGGFLGFLPVLCLPFFVIFILRPRMGLYLFVLYQLLEWVSLLALNSPHGFNPLASNIDKGIFLCVCSVGISYWSYQMADRP